MFAHQAPEQLFNAIINSDWETATALLAQGYVSCKVDQNNKSILHHAVIQNAAEIVKSILIIIEKKQMYWLREHADNQQKTPLHYAAENHFERCIAYLLGACANVDKRDIRGNTPLALYAANDEMCEKTFKRFQLYGADFYTINKFKCTLLHHTVDGFQDNFNMVARYFDAENASYAANGQVNGLIAMLVNQTNSQGASALRFAVEDDDLEAANWLLQNGARESKDNCDRREVHFAKSRAMIARLDAAGFNLLVKDDLDRTPIMTATIAGHFSVVKYIKEHATVDLNEKEKEKGYTVLHLALLAREPRLIVPMLFYFLEVGADNTIDNQGQHITHMSEWQRVKNDAFLQYFFSEERMQRLTLFTPRSVTLDELSLTAGMREKRDSYLQQGKGFCI